MEEDGDDWGELMWKYVEFGVQQKIKLPSFDTMLYLSDPSKTLAKQETSNNAELGVKGMLENGKYKDLVRLLLVDEKAGKEFDSYFMGIGVKFNNYPGFMTTEDKLAEIEAIVKEAEEHKNTKEEVEIEKEEPFELDPNDIEL